MSNPKQDKKPLGRGLSSLLPDIPMGDDANETKIDTSDSNFKQVKVEKIRPNPYQPRQGIPVASVMDLSESIKEKGVMSPLVVVKAKDGSDDYILVAGERRLQASKVAGIAEVPVIVRDLTDQEMAEIALIENLHRKDLNPIEEGYAFLRLMTEFKVSVDEIAQKISKTTAYIDNKLRLTRMPQILQNAIAVGEITEGHGRILTGLTDPQAMIATLKLVIRNGLNISKTEELVHQIKMESEKKLMHSSPTAEWKQKYMFIKDDLNDGFGWNVALKRNKKDGGSLVINFANDDELVSIYRKILGKSEDPDDKQAG